MSGPALSKLTWENQVHKQGGQNSAAEIVQRDRIIGHYSVPEAGQYFLEIIVTYCQDTCYETNARGVCLEDPQNHRLTDKNVSIDVSLPNSNYTDNHVELHDGQNETIIGYWYNKLEETQQEPLHTRYQPQNCRGPDTVETPRCKVSRDLSQFDPYEFRFNNQQISTTMIKEALQDRHESVCFVGCSHSKVMAGKANALIAKLKLWGNTKVHYLRITFATDLNEEKVQHLIELNCTKVVFATGQWDAGHPGRKPTEFGSYEQRLSQVLRNFDKGKGKFDLYFRQTQ